MEELNPHMLIGLGQSIEKWEYALYEIKRTKSNSDLIILVSRLRGSCGLCNFKKTRQEKELTESLTLTGYSMCTGCPYLYVHKISCTDDEFFDLLSYQTLNNFIEKEPNINHKLNPAYKQVLRSIRMCIIKLLLIKKHFDLRTNDDRGNMDNISLLLEE